MADVLFGKTEVDAVSLEMILGNMVQEQLIQKAMLLPTVANYVAPMGVDMLKIPKAGGFTVADKVENTSVDSQTITYSTDDLLLNKHKVIQVLVEKFGANQSQVNVLADIAARAGKALALQLDTDIITALEAVSTAAPDHKVAYVGASIAQADILAGIQALKEQYVDTSACYLGISPGSEKALLSIGDFVAADKYGSANVGLQSGVLGTIYGLKVITHTGFATAKSLIWHPDHVAVAIQESVSFDSEKDLANLATRYSWDMIYGVKTLAGGVKGYLMGTA